MNEGLKTKRGCGSVGGSVGGASNCIWAYEWSIHGSDNFIHHSTIWWCNNRFLTCFASLIVGKSKCDAKSKLRREREIGVTTSTYILSDAIV